MYAIRSYYAESIRSAPGDKIVAVVGAAHVPGVLKYIEQNTPIDLAALKTLPPPGKVVITSYSIHYTKLYDQFSPLPCLSYVFKKA